MTLKFDDLRAANLARLPEFRNAKGKIAHNTDGSNWSTAQWLQALVGEVGELANELKKVDRGDFTFNEAFSKIASELADIQTYLDLLAYRLGFNLGDVTIKKFNEVSERVGSSVRLSHTGWQREGGFTIISDP